MAERPDTAGVIGDSTDRPRIVAFAYRCMPGVGSEPGAGWLWARILAGLGDVWVLTRPHLANMTAIEGALRDAPERDSLHVVYVRLPGWARLIRGGGDATRFQRLEYVLWQLEALREARRLHRRYDFDLAWHLTLANGWIGSLAALVGPPFVYGPVGGGVAPPWRLVGELGLRGIAYELLRGAARVTGRRLNPVAALSWRRARLILVQNPDTRRWLPERARVRAEVFPNPVVDGAAPPRGERSGAVPTAIVVGRLMPLKATSLAIRAVARLPGWRLIVCGSGPDEPRLRHLTHQLGLDDRVDFRGWVARDEVLRIMASEADVMLFPSLHDEGPWAVAEAIACGLPVVCLDRGGAPELGARPVPSGSPAATAARLAVAAAAAVAQGDVPTRELDVGSRRSDLRVTLERHGLYPATGGRRRRRGGVLLLAGPDGSGKTLLADAVERSLAGDGPVLRVHHRVPLLPRRTRHVAPVVEPHRQPPYRRPLSGAKTLYLFLDTWLGWRIRVRPFVRRGGWVVIERGWWDMAIDPRRYRLDGVTGLVRALGTRLPRPDLRIVLDGPPGLLHARKPELTEAELDRQLHAWRTAPMTGERIVRLDASREPEVLLQMTLDEIGRLGPPGS